MCETLSAMQGLPECGMAKFLLILPRSWLAKNTPPPPHLNLGRAWHFEIWLAKNIPLQIQTWPELGTLSFDYPRIPLSPPLKRGRAVRVCGINPCIPISFLLLLLLLLACTEVEADGHWVDQSELIKMWIKWSYWLIQSFWLPALYKQYKWIYCQNLKRSRSTLFRSRPLGAFSQFNP